MKRRYRQLCYEDRKVIDRRLKEKYSVAKIAEEIGVCRDTIYKEIRRYGMTMETYNAETAQQRV